MRLNLSEICTTCDIPKEVFGSKASSDEKNILKILIKKNNATYVINFSNFLRQHHSGNGCMHHECGIKQYLLLGTKEFEHGVYKIILRPHEKFVCKKCKAERFLPTHINEEELEFLAISLRGVDGAGAKNNRWKKKEKN